MTQPEKITIPILQHHLYRTIVAKQINKARGSRLISWFLWRSCSNVWPPGATYRGASQIVQLVWAEWNNLRLIQVWWRQGHPDGGCQPPGAIPFGSFGPAMCQNESKDVTKASDMVSIVFIFQILSSRPSKMTKVHPKPHQNPSQKAFQETIEIWTSNTTVC